MACEPRCWVADSLTALVLLDPSRPPSTGEMRKQCHGVWAERFPSLANLLAPESGDHSKRTPCTGNRQLYSHVDSKLLKTAPVHCHHRATRPECRHDTPITWPWHSKPATEPSEWVNALCTALHAYPRLILVCPCPSTAATWGCVIHP